MRTGVCLLLGAWGGGGNGPRKDEKTSPILGSTTDRRVWLHACTHPPHALATLCTMPLFLLECACRERQDQREAK